MKHLQTYKIELHKKKPFENWNNAQLYFIAQNHMEESFRNPRKNHFIVESHLRIGTIHNSISQHATIDKIITLKKTNTFS